MRKAVLFVLAAGVAGGLWGAVAQAEQGTREAQVMVVVDPDGDNGDVTPGLLGSAGYFFTEQFSAGVYGSWTELDRRWPNKMTLLWGLGAYGEYTFENDMNVVPFVGGRFGFEDGDGPSDPTVMHAVVSAGVKIYLIDLCLMTVGASFHWADEGLFDYRETDVDGVAELKDTNITLDIGIRYLF